MLSTHLTSGQTLPYPIPSLLFLKVARFGPRVLGHNMGVISRDWHPRLTVEGLTLPKEWKGKEDKTQTF